MANNRIVWLDIGKVIAIVCVVLGHSIIGLDSPIKHAIFSFHMPLFFIYAGITLRPKPIRTVLQTSAKRLLVPFFLLYIICAMLVLLKWNSVSFEGISKLGFMLLFSSAVTVKPWGFPAIGMIWFLMVLFISRMIINALLLICEKHDIGLVAQLVFYLCATAIGIIISRYMFLPLSFDLVPLACLFVFLGYAAKKIDLIDVLLSWPYFIISLMVWLVSLQFCWFSMGDRMFQFAPLAIIGALSATILVSKISSVIEGHFAHLSSVLAFLGVNSLLIFALHCVEGRIVHWLEMPLISILPTPGAYYAAFLARFVFIICIVFVFKAMPISGSQSMGKGNKT